MIRPKPLSENNGIGTNQRAAKNEIKRIVFVLKSGTIKMAINEKVKIIRKSGSQHSKIINVPAVAAKVILLNV